MANATVSYDLPPLPAYTLTPQPPLISGLPDVYLSMGLLIVVYWGLSMVFHVMDVYDLFPQYRLHTPAELLKRNHVTRWEVFRDVIIQQIMQTVCGVGLAYFEPPVFDGKDYYNVAVWAQRVRLSQRTIPSLLALVGLDAKGMAQGVATSYPLLAGALSGGSYPWLSQLVVTGGHQQVVPAFAEWEIVLAKAIYWAGIPALQFFGAVLFLDTWQYFMHRLMHENKYLYATFHSRHHRLYVPYAYGALYNHPFEGLMLEMVGSGLAYLVVGMSIRQSMCFYIFSTFKTVDDHCGYALPFDPLQFISSNNAAYHDIHHQSWGIKTNFSQPFFTFWDRILGTMWKGGDVTARYEKSRIAAQAKLDKDLDLAPSNSTQESTTPEISEVEEPSRTPAPKRRSNRNKDASTPQHSNNLKGLGNRVNGSLHGKGGNVVSTH